MVKRFLSIGGLVLAGAGLLGTAQATAAPRAASPADWDPCVAGYSCYYAGYNGTGYRWLAPSCGDFTGGSWVKSVFNRGSGTVYLYATNGAVYVAYIGDTINIYDPIGKIHIDC